MFLQAIGRNCHVVNLDFANDTLPYDVAIDIRDLISVEVSLLILCGHVVKNVVPLQKTMAELNLGPNGAFTYCMEYLLENVDWLLDEIRTLDSPYIIFDCPGQVNCPDRAL